MRVQKTMRKSQLRFAIDEHLAGLIRRIERAIEHHEKFAKSYFWTPPGGAAARREMESRESFAVFFPIGGDRFAYSSEVTCSCKNVYYTGEFYFNGEKKNVRVFKRALELLRG